MNRVFNCPECGAQNFVGEERFALIEDAPLTCWLCETVISKEWILCETDRTGAELMERKAMDEKIVILITTGSEDEALRIARALVEEHLAACANIVSGVRSIYRWKGDICDDREFLMMVKTRRAHFSRVEERVRQLHSYEVPEIISFSIQEGNDAYLQWMEEQTLE